MVQPNTVLPRVEGLHGVGRVKFERPGQNLQALLILPNDVTAAVPVGIDDGTKALERHDGRVEQH